MATYDLTATAAGNAGARRAAALAVVAADGTGQIERFRSLASASAFGTNVGPDKMRVFGERGAVVDARSYHIHRAGGDRPAGLRSFEQAQGVMFAPRQAFEDLWDHGRSLVYGAVNAGGMGVEAPFGYICLVLRDPERCSPDALALFPGDSAQRYADATGSVDVSRALAEVTAWGDRAALAVVEREAGVTSVPRNGWPLLLCDSVDYLETVVAAPLVGPGDIAEIRIRRALRRRLDTLRARHLNGEPLNATEQGELAAYDVVHSWRREHGVAVIDVD